MVVVIQIYTFDFVKLSMRAFHSHAYETTILTLFNYWDGIHQVNNAWCTRFMTLNIWKMVFSSPLMKSTFTPLLKMKVQTNIACPYYSLQETVDYNSQSAENYIWATSKYSRLLTANPLRLIIMRRESHLHMSGEFLFDEKDCIFHWISTIFDI